MNFVVIASPRTGSTHLVNLLSGHPEVFSNGNIFKRGKLQLFWPEKDLTPETRSELLKLKTESPARFLEKVLATGYGRPHVGFKIFCGQNDQILESLIVDPKIGKIVLYRKNVLARYSSVRLAVKTGQYQLLAGWQRAANAKVNFIEKQYTEFQKKSTGFYRDVIDNLNGSRQSFYMIYYEDLDDETTISSLINFIGADPHRVPARESQHAEPVKQNSSDILSRFGNRDVVEEYLRSHGLMHWACEGQTADAALPECDYLPIHSGPAGVGPTPT